ncbi:hypothetical protein DPEC_G00304350 [Dallia pectoralis]|uniref:Uncharacterized protein n=1 Tax=Dallia pectoralis TaxID=75939 RepID=A0ACC2FDH0_DALPE|nr:hypothetical protein DPEC_G00304350 [Dallia pectoralis]
MKTKQQFAVVSVSARPLCDAPYLIIWQRHGAPEPLGRGRGHRDAMISVALRAHGEMGAFSKGPPIKPRSRDSDSLRSGILSDPPPTNRGLCQAVRYGR